MSAYLCKIDSRRDAGCASYSSTTDKCNVPAVCPGIITKTRPDRDESWQGYFVAVRRLGRSFISHTPRACNCEVAFDDPHVVLSWHLRGPIDGLSVSVRPPSARVRLQ